MLKTYSRETGSLFQPEDVLAISRAKTVTFYTTFPLGLAVLPGMTSPLQCLVPVWYHPMNPLASAVEFGLRGIPQIFIRTGFRVLYVECISDEDYIHDIAKIGHDHIEHILGNIDGIQFEYVSIKRFEEVAEALGNHEQLDVLILSAHGRRDPETGVAGIDIAGRICTGLEWPGVPPLVILVACSMSPRGDNAPSIADILLHRGAVAVLGTLVPIDAVRSIDIIARLFATIITSTQGLCPSRTLADAWLVVQRTCVVNDIVSATTELKSWASENWDTLVDKFEAACADGRIKSAGLYEDTGKLIASLAARAGLTNDSLDAIGSQRYIPESLFYIMLGAPQRIILRDLPLEQARASVSEFDMLGRQKK